MAETIAETDRLRVRTWSDADLAPFIAATNTSAVMQWLGGVMDDAPIRASIARWRAGHAEYGHGFWLVERLTDGELLGFCGLKRCDAPGALMQGDIEIGWRFAETAWGHGYAREAAEACLTLAFARYAARHVVAITVNHNAASWGLMLRLGMIRARELDFADHRMPHDIARHTIVYRIEKRDWTQ